MQIPQPFRTRSTVAASEEPPPRPPPTGRLFSSARSAPCRRACVSASAAAQRERTGFPRRTTPENRMLAVLAQRDADAVGAIDQAEHRLQLVVAACPALAPPSTCRKRFSFPGAGYQLIGASLPLRDREAQLDAGIGEAHARGQLRRRTPGIRSSSRAPRASAAGPARHSPPLRGLVRGLPRTQSASPASGRRKPSTSLGQRLGIARPVLARLRRWSAPPHRLCARCAPRPAPSGVVISISSALLRVAPGDVAAECVLAVARRDAAAQDRTRRPAAASVWSCAQPAIKTSTTESQTGCRRI